MEIEELTDCKSEGDNARDLVYVPNGAHSQLTSPELSVNQDLLNGNTSAIADMEVGKRNDILVLETEVNGYSNKSSSVLQATVESSEITAVAKDSKCLCSGIRTDNECLIFEDGSPIGKRKRDGDNEIYKSSTSSVMKARMTIDEQKPRVRVMYSSLPRKSKQKLQELLQQWSEWHTQHCSPAHDSDEVLETGEGTYFPALLVGVENPSTVAFWMDNQIRDPHSTEFVALDSSTAPLYDRAFTLEGDLGKLDASRCFNCGSYSHSLNGCPKPCDNVAVNNSRKLHQLKSNLKSPSFRTPTRYYQNSPGGKYDGLMPGVLHAETWKLLGLGELDPPPWLHRMREIGYPPGYLEPEIVDRPSGITIFAGVDCEEEEEEENSGKLLETDHPKPPKKMSVQFPGVNALIPENADPRKWARPSSLDLPRNGPTPSPLYSFQLNGIGHYHDQRWPRDGLGPPSRDPVLSSIQSSFSPSYRSYGGSSGHISPTSISSFPFQGGNISGTSPLAYAGSPHSNLHSRPCPPEHGGRFSPINYGVLGYERRY